MTPEQKKGSEEFPNLKSKQIITIVEDEDHVKNKEIRGKSGEVPPPPPPPIPTKSKDGDMPPPPPPVPTVKGAADVPAPPPPPPSPVEAVKGWIEEGATFFYNGKSISAKQALEIVKENDGKNLSVQVEENASGKSVRLNINKESNPNSTGSKSPVKDGKKKYTNPMTRSETIEHLRQMATEGVTFTYLGKEITVDETIKHLQRPVTLRYSEVNSKKIMRVEDL